MSHYPSYYYFPLSQLLLFPIIPDIPSNDKLLLLLFPMIPLLLLLFQSYFPLSQLLLFPIIPVIKIINIKLSLIQVITIIPLSQLFPINDNIPRCFCLSKDHVSLRKKPGGAPLSSTCCPPDNVVFSPNNNNDDETIVNI